MAYRSNPDTDDFTGAWLVPARQLLDPDTDMWHWIAVDLAFWRTKHKLSQEALAKIMGCKKALVSNIENGRPTHRMNNDHAKAADEYFELGIHFQRLVRYARNGHSPEWFIQHVGYERRALIIRECALGLIPGLLQTPEYIRTLVEGGPGVPNVEATIEERLRRQTILARKNPPELRVLLAEAILDVPIGGSIVHRGQLAHLLDQSASPDTTIQVVPNAEGFQLGLEGSFTVVTVPETTVAFFDSCGQGRLEQDSRLAMGYESRFAKIASSALTVRASREAISLRLEAL